ncbi:hypothetical protein M5K25_003549 [Dendrobium thyrsiflorum]|uniref:Uncharacterized protein n=1 Tax=Dendrobium thyrsiflorum TaxID=117978 RepID=A0ABD0VKI8_DENTH
MFGFCMRTFSLSSYAYSILMFSPMNRTTIFLSMDNNNDTYPSRLLPLSRTSSISSLFLLFFLLLNLLLLFLLLFDLLLYLFHIIFFHFPAVNGGQLLLRSLHGFLSFSTTYQTCK